MGLTMIQRRDGILPIPCPRAHCKGILTRDWDGYEDTYACAMCGRQFGKKVPDVNSIEDKEAYG